MRLNRSAHYEPKYTHYASDGAGWDAYIIANNGGLLALESIKIP